MARHPGSESWTADLVELILLLRQPSLLFHESVTTSRVVLRKSNSKWERKK